MNKQNKLVLKAVKAALRVVEAVEKAEESKLDNRFGTSRRPQNSIPNYHGCPEPPTGKIPKGNYTIEELERRGGVLFHRGNGDPKEQGCEAVGPFTSRVLNAQREEIKRLKNPEKPIEDFAGDDRSHVYSLIEKHLGLCRTDTVFQSKFVHLKSPELGTETLVVLSPEGETLLKIVKDNSRKFEVK